MLKTRKLLLVLTFLIVCIFGGCSPKIDRLEGEVIELSSSTGTSEPTTGFYCEGKINTEVEERGYFLIELSFGYMDIEYFDHIRKKSVNVTVSAINDNSEEYKLKEIKGTKFFSDEYLCYYSEGKKKFNHTEIMEVPTELLIGEEGMLTIAFSGQTTDTEKGFAATFLNIHYKKENSKIYFSKYTDNIQTVINMEQGLMKMELLVG